MTYQEKFDELQKSFSQRFDVYEKFQKELSLGIEGSDKFLIAKSEFEKISYDFQAFLIMFKENNAKPGDEFGTTDDRCA